MKLITFFCFFMGIVNWNWLFFFFILIHSGCWFSLVSPSRIMPGCQHRECWQIAIQWGEENNVLVSIESYPWPHRPFKDVSRNAGSTLGNYSDDSWKVCVAVIQEAGRGLSSEVAEGLPGIWWNPCLLIIYPGWFCPPRCPLEWQETFLVVTLGSNAAVA